MNIRCYFPLLRSRSLYDNQFCILFHVTFREIQAEAHLFVQTSQYRAVKTHKRAGIATAYGLDGPVIESRWGERNFAPVQTGPEDHTTSCTMGTGSLPGVRCCRGVTLTPHTLLVPRSKIEYSYTSTLPKGLRGP